MLTEIHLAFFGLNIDVEYFVNIEEANNSIQPSAFECCDLRMYT